MQATLVALYGYKKPLDFIHFVVDCQAMVGRLLDGAFNSYPNEQVHATVIGLEGVMQNDRILNSNFMDVGQQREMDCGRVIDVWRDMGILTVQVGGWQNHDYGFTNGMGEYPDVGSFFIRGGLVGAMGWPISEGSAQGPYPESLYALRRQFENEANALHRWHKNPEFTDNDFFFRLGLTPLGDDHPLVSTACERMRQYISQRAPVVVAVKPEDLTAVAYVDNKLPWGSAGNRDRHDVGDVTSRWLRDIYTR